MIGEIAAVAGPILGGIFGGGQAAADRAEARRQIEAAVAKLEAVGVPSAEAMAVTLQHLKSAGQLTPEYEEAIGQKDTELKNIQLDPRSKEAQYRALDELEQQGDGGLRLGDEAAMAEAMGTVQTKQRGARDAIEGSLKARGAFGSGAELASKLAANQEGAQEANAIGLKTAGAAQDRALQAIIQAGEMGGNIRGQEFGEQKAITSAQDAINAFNTSNSRAVVERNTAAKNAAQQFNLSNDQRISDENTGLANKEQVYNKELQQKQYESELQKAQSVANARAGQASQLSKDAAATGKQWAGVGQGVGQIGATLATAPKPKMSSMGPGSMANAPTAQPDDYNLDDDERYQT